MTARRPDDPVGLSVEVVAGQGALGAAMREAWRSRELAGFFIWRDMKIRYNQAILGAAWVVIQPLALVAVLAVSVGRFAGLAVGREPYWLFVLVGLTPWTVVAQGVEGAANSLVTNSGLITKTHFPRLVLPLASVGSHAVDAVLPTAVSVGAAALVSNPSPTAAVAVPVALLLASATAFGFGSVLAVLNARYRDVRIALRPAIQAWFFATPVIYPVSVLSDQLGTFARLNPALAPIELMRWSLLGAEIDRLGLLMSTGSATLLVVVGAVVFARAEAGATDVV